MPKKQGTSNGEKAANPHLILLQSLVLQQPRPKLLVLPLLRLLLHDMHLNRPRQYLIRRSFRIDGFKEFNVYFVIPPLGNAFEFQCGVLEVDGFVFDV
jgi:hypothetical protein